MMKNKIYLRFILLVLCCFGNSCSEDSNPSDTNTLNSEKSFGGYTLFNPNNGQTAYLIDENGKTVHTWNNLKRGGYSVYLLENGQILRPAQINNSQLNGGASSGLIQKIDWNGNVVWEFEYSSVNYLTHHDIEPMPNGNVLLIAWEVKTEYEVIEAGGIESISLWPDHIIEVEPTGVSGGNIIWEWHVWDHLVQDHDPTKENYGIFSDHPELIDINIEIGSRRPGSGGDWLHINGISYNERLDQIVISSHFTDEIYIIDHSTTTIEATGHSGGNSGMGGDILYRWGNPSNYGKSAAQHFDVIHNSYWIPEGVPGGGNIMVFNNGESNRISEIVEISLPVSIDGKYDLETGSAFAPTTPDWTYSDNTNFFSFHLGSNQRLPNGNTFIAESTSGYLFEVTMDGEKVWEYSFGQEIARALRYAPEYAGLNKLFE